jgi:hypothetical protein
MVQEPLQYQTFFVVPDAPKSAIVGATRPHFSASFPLDSADFATIAKLAVAILHLIA